MTFEEQMNLILDHWSSNPIPDDIKDTEQYKLMHSTEGVIQQLDNLPSGPGTVYVALNEGDNKIAIKTLTIFKD